MLMLMLHQNELCKEVLLQVQCFPTHTKAWCSFATQTKTPISHNSVPLQLG